MTEAVAPAHRRRDGLVRPWLVAGAAAGTLVALASVDPNEPGHYPTCPFLAATGLWCPGCGSLRAMHALTRLDVVTAWERNPLAVLAVPVLVLAWVRWVLDSRGGRGSSLARRLHPVRVPARVLWLALGLVLLYWVARNVPGWTWLSPA